MVVVAADAAAASDANVAVSVVVARLLATRRVHIDSSVIVTLNCVHRAGFSLPSATHSHATQRDTAQHDTVVVSRCQPPPFRLAKGSRVESRR